MGIGARHAPSVEVSASMSGGFDEHARVLTRRYAQIGAAILALFPLAWIPFDERFFLRGDGVPDSFYVVRFVMCGAAAAWLLALRAWPARRVYWTVGAMLPVLSALLGVQFGLTGELAIVFFPTGYFMPLLTVPVLVRFPARVAVTALVVFPFLAGFFGTAPELLHDPGVARQVSSVFFGSLVSLVGGHALFHLVRENHSQRSALQQRARDLQELDRLKDELFANVSHELRTPLTLILASLGELRAMPHGEDGERAIDTGERNASRLLEMIEDLLELARFESGRAAPSTRPIDLARLVREVSSNFSPSSPENGTLTVRGCDEELAAEADPRQLRSALYNLLSNAYKFTSPDDRRIEVELEHDAEQARIRVRDNGPGIPASAREHVFDRFYRADTSSARRQRGTGIGLALVSEIARAHGGAVALESEEGHGSTFTLALPRGDVAERPGIEPDEEVREQRDPRAPLVPDEAFASDRAGPDAPIVLVAEDDAELRAYLVRVLASRYRVVSAADGSEAARRARAEEPALIVTDVAMPGMSGHELVRELRSSERSSRLPVLLLTARADARARAEAYAAGADDFLTKPFDEAELLARTDNLLRLRASERALATTNEILERRVAERTAELRELARHLQRSREDERQRLARELHDETGQLLTALRMALDQTRRKNEDTSIVPLLQRMSDVLDQAFAVTRHLVSELRPRVLDDLGLGEAAAWYLEEFQAHAPLRCRWSVDPPELTSSPEASTAFFRTIQEALTNAARHSRAENVEVRLGHRDGVLSLDISDDGQGFDTIRVTEGFGLLGMRERAEAIGGTLSIESGPGAGTRLRLQVPSRGAEATA